MPEVILSDYFYDDESEEFIYFKIPRLLITDQKFKHVSTDAKLLYGMLLDRMGLSVKNDWYDDSGRVYIYYTVDEICEDMCCGRDKAMKLLAELDRGKGIGLIERVKQGQGRPTKLYVKRFTTRTAPPKPAPPTPRDFLPNSEVDFSDIQRSEKSTSRIRKSRRPEVEKTDPNHIKKNHPDFSHPGRNRNYRMKGSISMIMKKNNKPDTLTQRQTRRARRLYFTCALAVTLCAALAVPAFAAGAEGDDPLTIVNNLSDFIFSCIKAIGVIILGWGIVQLGMSIQSHDASQRSQGMLCVFGGLIIAFSKEILSTIGAV